MKAECETGTYANTGVSSGSALFATINTILVMVDYKIIYEQDLIHFALIGMCLWGGNTYIITKAVKIGFIEINSGSTHTFCTSIRIVIESSHIFGPNAYANAFLRIRSYAPAYVYSLTYQYFMLSALFPQEKKSMELISLRYQAPRL